MVKHNNIIPNQHFRKDWQRYVRTWFNQPAKKQARRVARAERAKKLAPRPVQPLRPIVHCPTVKYNQRVRVGRGFTAEELKAAGIHRRAARGFGIVFDHRRKNRSEEAFTLNVNRLKLYQSKLVVFPRKTSKAKTGDSKPEDIAQAKQTTSKITMGITQPKAVIKARKITEEERAAEVRTVLRKALTDQKRAGARAKRVKDKLEEAAGKKPKAAAEDAADE